jgi:Cu2+-containing amine oxidase
MRFARNKQVGLLALLAILGFLVGAPAAQLRDGRADKKPASAPANELVQQFPTNDAMKTAWKIHWATSKGYGLYIQDAWFKRGPKEDWMQVLGDARLAEMFVPYHSGSPRFWDISYNFPLCHVNKDDCGPYGKVLDNAATVVHEVRDRGLMWVDGTKGTRRGQKLVLFGILNAANYRYVIEYGFQDDGAISFQVGSTGRNYSSREFEGHMHNGLWRIDANIGGPENNSVLVMEHMEPVEPDKAMARTIHRPFNGGLEGYEEWDPIKFTMLSVQNEQKRNARDQPMAYDFMMSQHGSGRHYGPDKEECTQHDFWVTQNRKGEIYYQKLPSYIKRGEPIMNSDVVIWLSTPGHHEPRSEDGELKGTAFNGVTPIMWCGFMMKPRNVWDRSPFYP